MRKSFKIFVFIGVFSVSNFLANGNNGDSIIIKKSTILKLCDSITSKNFSREKINSEEFSFCRKELLKKFVYSYLFESDLEILPYYEKGFLNITRELDEELYYKFKIIDDFETWQIFKTISSNEDTEITNRKIKLLIFFSDAEGYEGLGEVNESILLLLKSTLKKHHSDNPQLNNIKDGTFDCNAIKNTKSMVDKKKWSIKDLDEAIYIYANLLYFRGHLKCLETDESKKSIKDLKERILYGLEWK